MLRRFNHKQQQQLLQQQQQNLPVMARRGVRRTHDNSRPFGALLLVVAVVVTGCLIAGCFLLTVSFVSTTTTTTTTTSSSRSSTTLPTNHHRVIMSAASDTAATTAAYYYDVVIAGAGPAGLTAALFAARAGLSVLVLGSSVGALSEAGQLDNFPSFTTTSEKGGAGAAWLAMTRQQAAAAGVQFAAPGLLVSRLVVMPSQQQQQHDSMFQVHVGLSTSSTSVANNNNPLVVPARSVIIATGATGKRLDLPYEDELWGKAVHSCAICDGSMYSSTNSASSDTNKHNKNNNNNNNNNTVVIVVGGGDAAVEAAILLARHATTVVLVHRRTSLRATHQGNLQTLQGLPHVHLQTPYILTEYVLSNAHDTGSRLAGVVLRHVEHGTTQRLTADGVFVMIGATPNTGFLRDTPVTLDDHGLVMVKRDSDGTTMSSSVPGVFAAGEVTDSRYKQAITAAAAGAQAAIDAERWLRSSSGSSSSSSFGVKVGAPRRPPDLDIPLQNNIPTLHESKSIQQQQPKTKTKQQQDYDDCDLTLPDCITALVHKFPVVVFSKPWCGYCRKALEALSLEGVRVGEPALHIIDLSSSSNTANNKARQIQTTLQSMTGRRTVPNVFVGAQSIGGGDETVSLHQAGKLRSILQAAGALDKD